MRKQVIAVLCAALLLTGCGAQTDTQPESPKKEEAAQTQQYLWQKEPVEVESLEELKAEELVPMEDLTGWASVEGAGLSTVTGGGNAAPQVVTTEQELRQLAHGSEPRVIVIQGMITCESRSGAVEVGSNKTIVGLDENAQLRGGLRIDNAANVIISNLTVDAKSKYSGVVDGIAAHNTHHIWLHHLTVKNASDGIVDLTLGSDYITVSWCRFSYDSTSYEHRLACLVGSGTGHDDTDMGKLNATYHHNWFENKIAQRMPRILYGKGHVYNNYYTSKNNDYCVGVGSYASVLIENNYFKNVENPHQFMYASALPAYITARGNVYDNIQGAADNGAAGTNCGYVEPFTDPPYEYAADEGSRVPELVSKGAGPQPFVILKGQKATPEPSSDPYAFDPDKGTITYEESENAYTFHGQQANGDNAFLEIKNPFAGLKLDEELTLQGGYPAWKSGVTISYWLYMPKSANDAPILNFNLADDRQMSNLDAWKYKLCQNYSKEDQEYSLGTKQTYYDEEENEYTVLEDAGKYVCFHPDYPKEGCYKVDAKGVIPAHKKGDDETVYLSYLGEGQYAAYSKRFDEPGGENSRIREARIDGSLSLYASASVGYRQDNGTGMELNPNMPGFGTISPIQVYNQFYYWGNGSRRSREEGMVVPTMNQQDQWHFITVVIQNDFVQYYVDGQKMDENYLNWWGKELWNEKVAGDAFNYGYGMRLQYSSNNPASIFTTGKSILEFITDENTVLLIGGTGYAASNLGQGDIQTMNDVRIKELTFYDQVIPEQNIGADGITGEYTPLSE